MIGFLIDTVLLMSATFALGCGIGCWARKAHLERALRRDGGEARR